MNKTLYEINEEYRAWYEAVLEADGEISSELDLQHSDILADRDAKIEAYAVMIKNTVIEAEAYKAEKARLAAEQAKLEGLTEKLSDRLAEALTFYKLDKFRTVKCNISFRNTAAVNITDEDDIPDDYFTIKRTVSKEAIGKAIKSGITVPGAELKEGRSIQVK